MPTDYQAIISFLRENVVDFPAIGFFLLGAVCFFLICFFIIAMLSSQKGRYGRLFLGLLCIIISCILYGVFQHFKGIFDFIAGIIIAAIYTEKLYPSKWVNKLLKFWVLQTSDIRGFISDDAKNEIERVEET